MSGLSGFFRLLLISVIASNTVVGDDHYWVNHIDPIQIDAQLTLSELIELTMQNYPEGALIPALKQEAEALQRRGDSWVAGALNANFYYRNSWLKGAAGTGAPELEGNLEFPLWNWGQREAGQELAKQAKRAGEYRIAMIKLQVAGLVRKSLWDMALVNNRYETALRGYEVSERLVATVKRRVELGDLPRTDLLLAESEQLSKRSEVVKAEAEKMHARHRYTSLTQLNRLPADFSEESHSFQEIKNSHPALIALNAKIERRKSELTWVKAAGSGQSTFSIGGNSQRGDPSSVSVETIVMEVNVPFGGEAHLAPEIAATNLELNSAIIERDHLHRQLKEAFHEAKHALEIDRAELNIAKQHREIAKTHLKMTHLSFDAGEIDLLDLLKIQSLAHAAIHDADERVIILQRDIAFYNQVSGQLP